MDGTAVAQRAATESGPYGCMPAMGAGWHGTDHVGVRLCTDVFDASPAPAAAQRAGEV